MRISNGYVLSLVALMLVYFCDGANLRFKRSEIESNLDSNGFCITEKTWTVDCNQCFCAAKGAPACTLIGCSHGPELVSIIIEPEKEKIQADIKVKRSVSTNTNVDKGCEPGTTWAVDCNTCWCTDKGLTYCTKIGCVDLGK